ncbi:MAG: hypothetical protein Q9M91_04100 [Candidatus Dojkabacteria bacterium]|nr:hypothetical protein [Candidatus Dojkabacteria bacterium]
MEIQKSINKVFIVTAVYVVGISVFLANVTSTKDNNNDFIFANDSISKNNLDGTNEEIVKEEIANQEDVIEDVLTNAVVDIESLKDSSLKLEKCGLSFSNITNELDSKILVTPYRNFFGNRLEGARIFQTKSDGIELQREILVECVKTKDDLVSFYKK